MNGQTLKINAKLFEDSKWKIDCLSKLEIILDDSRNPEAACFADVGDFMEFGKEYIIELSITEKE